MSPGRTTVPTAIAAAIRAELPTVAERTVAAIVVEVPSYADAFGGEMGHAIENAVQLALGGFLELAASGGTVDAGTPVDPALDGALGDVRQLRTHRSGHRPRKVLPTRHHERLLVSCEQKLPPDSRRWHRYLTAGLGKLST